MQQQRERQQRAGNLRDAVRRICIENECICFCEPIKGQSKTTKTYLCLLIFKNCTRERTSTDTEPQNYSFIAYPFSKQPSTLLRHGHLPRKDDEVIEFWRFKEYHRTVFMESQYWSDEMCKSTMAKGGGNKKIFQQCADPSAQEILYLRAFQGHSGRSLIDPSLQDIILIPNDFFEYILHSIENSGLIAGGNF